MRLVLSYMKPYRLAAVVALALMLVELAVELWHPILMARIINEGILERDSAQIIRLGIMMAVVALLGFAAGIVNSFYAAHVSQGLGFDLRKVLWGKVQSFPFAQFNRFPAATLITRMTSDVTQLQNLVFMGLRIMMRAPLMMVGGLIMALTINVKLGLILIVVTPLMFGLLVGMMNRGFILFRDVQEKLDRTNAVLRENLLGMRLIKALVQYGHEHKRFTRANDELADRTIRAIRLAELTVPALLFVMNISVLFILWFGSRQVIGGRADVGEIVAVVNYATRITGAFSVISFIMTGLSRAKASAGRISEVLRSEEDDAETVHAEDRRNGLGKEEGIPAAAVTFECVTFRYPDTPDAVLSNISFDVAPGEKVAILGATGSGKSSLFQLLPRLYDPESGTVRIDGWDIRAMDPERLRGQIGYVPQEAVLFTGTVRDNLLWGKEDASLEEVMGAARHAQIHDSIMRLPAQYETMLAQKGVNLSGGQKQRLSVARALIRRPRLLLLDDSTSALDMRTEAALLAALKHYSCTTLIITQKISTAMEADKILILQDGRLQDQGSHSELMAGSALYRQIIYSQFGEETADHV